MSETLEPYFRVDGDTAIPSVHGAGPWDPGALHGGAPSLLVAWIVDNVMSKVPMSVARLTIDLKRPVPIAPLKIETEITREGRQIQTVEVRLSAEGKECVRATALRTRRTDYKLPPEAGLPPLTIEGPDGLPPREGMDFKGPQFNKSIDMRIVPSEADGRGRAAGWFRFRRPFLAGEETTPLMRASAIADFSSGIGCPLDFRRWMFINADLSIHFARPPRGEWFMLASEVWIGPDGRGTGHGRLADGDGFFGRCTQSLVVGPR